MTAFARELGIITTDALFIAVDGEHSAQLHTDGLISLQMKDVDTMDIHEGHTVLNTGSPHYVQWVKDVVHADVYGEGSEIRYRDEYQPGGVNVNFAQVVSANKLLVRTYERGVEDETLSCGTGVVAAAIAATAQTTGIFATMIETPGGNLEVTFTKHSALAAVNVVLTGPAEKVFSGDIMLKL